jgi:Squalene-hopene cyclase C-terminal domain
MSPIRIRAVLSGVLAVVLAANSGRADEPAPLAALDAQTLENTVQKGIEFLRVKGIAEDGSYSNRAGIGVTALVATALMRHGVPPTDPAVAKSLAYLERHAQPAGGIFPSGSRLKNYETCLAVLCFSEANRDGRYDNILKGANGYLKGLQGSEQNGQTLSDPGYGGAGYGGDSRADLSNTNFLIDALKAAGNDADSEAIQRALTFVSRCQNLETEHNTTPFAAKNPDGGFYYSPIGEGSSPAGKTPKGGLRSYGAMTYAGLKSMIFAGVAPGDPRVQAATEWIQQHYDLENNPGLGDAGLYYYYHLFAKALDALGEDVIVDADGRRHDWRAELVRELASRQQEDGSWVNSNDRWFEGDANLVTGYALLALSHCKPKQP